MDKGKKVLLWVVVIGAATGVAACFIVLRAYGVWENANVVNFLAAWIPFALSILLAFIPDGQMPVKTRVVWRSHYLGQP